MLGKSWLRLLIGVHVVQLHKAMGRFNEGHSSRHCGGADSWTEDSHIGAVDLVAAVAVMIGNGLNS